MDKVSKSVHSQLSEGCHADSHDSLLNTSWNSVENREETLTGEIIDHSLDIKNWLPQIKPNRDRESQIESLLKEGESLEKRSSTLSVLLRRFISKIRSRASLEIVDVTNLCLDDGEHFWGGWLDCPKKDDKVNGHVIFISGWVLGKKCSAVSISVTIDGTQIAQIPVNVSRSGVAQTYSFLKNIDNSGYTETLYIPELPNQGTLRLEAVFADGKLASVGVIKYCKY